MKKIFICFFSFVIMAAICVMPVSALSAVDNASMVNDIKQIAKEHTKVKDVTCVAFSNTCGIALRCDGIYFQEDKNTLKSSIIEKVQQKYPQLTTIYVRLDLDIFLKLQKIEQALSNGKSMFSLRKEIIEVLNLAKIRE